jgi:hypothetical protein
MRLVLAAALLVPAMVAASFVLLAVQLVARVAFP